MNNDDNMNSAYNDDSSITINISDLPDTTYSYTSDTIASGVIAQEIGSITLDSSYFNGNITIANGSSSTWSFTSDVKANTINTDRSSIDIDELADIIETVKKRLLILTPSFEMHEKYPMLKELYDEYKAMEKLLSGPDSNNE